MSTPDPRLSRRDAERLLDAPAEHDSVLGWALTAASAPADPSELRGEDAAAAAFQAARLSPPPASRTGYVSPARLGSRAAARAVVATGAIVALTSGGFALASSTGLPGLPELPGLPGLPGQASDRASESLAGTPRGTTASSDTPGDSGSSSASSTGTSGASGSTGSSTPPGSPSSTSSTSSTSQAPSGSPTQTTDGPASPTPNFEGLCRAFQATDRTGSGNSLDSAAFLALAAEAGGADRIATYCIDLIGPPKQTGSPTDKPTPTTKPTPTKPTPTKPTPTKPTPTKPTPTKPTPSPGKPTDTPTPSSGKPTDTPTPTPGKPSDLPTPDGSGGAGGSGNPGKGGGNQTSG